MKASFSRSLRQFCSVVAMTGLAVCATVQPANAQVTTDIFTGHGSGDGTPFSGYVGTLFTPGITFGTDTGYNWHPFGLSGFGAHSFGTLSVAVTENYTFGLKSDDGSSLYIDSALVISNPGPHGPSLALGSAFLTAGLHSVDVNFFECCGGESGVNLLLAPGTAFTTAVPEPETYAMLLAGLGLLGFAARRRKLQAA